VFYYKMVPNKWLTNMYEQDLPQRGNVVYSPALLEGMEVSKARVNECNNRHRSHYLALGSVQEFNSSTVQKPKSAGDTRILYDTEDLHGIPITILMPKISSKEVYDLIIKNYNTIAKDLDKKEVARTDERAIYTVKAVKREQKHEDKKECCSPNSMVDVEDTPYRYWRERYLGHGVEPKTWQKTKYNNNTKDWVYEFIDHVELTPKQNAENERRLTQWQATREKLVHNIMKHRDRLMHVDQIICFGLGALSCRRPRSFVQHLAAVTVGHTIQAIRDKSDEYMQSSRIKILAQDPAYCSNCKDVLKEQLGIRAVTTFEGHRSLNKTTLTISIAPGAPICQMIADLTREFGGPAAMMCDAFGDNYLAEEELENPEGTFASDEPTKNMVYYKRRCEVEDLEDAKDVLGMAYDEFKERYPYVPIVQLNEWIEQGKDIIDLTEWYTKGWLDDKMVKALEERMERERLSNSEQESLEESRSKYFQKLSEDEKKYFDECMNLHQSEGEVYFPNFTLYVRKD
jgi:hypothetical protein